MQLIYRIAADVIVVAHMSYVLVILVGLIVTWIGILLGHSWAKNFWWRMTHLTMMLIVVAESWAGIICPLTVWEQQLRDMAGQKTYSGSFIGNIVHDWLFFELPSWMFTAAYSAFGLLIVLSFILAPPRWPRRRRVTEIVVKTG